MINLKEFFNAIGNKKRNFYANLSESKLKEFDKTVFVLMRWCSHIENKTRQQVFLYMTNELVNLHFNTLHKHKELQYLLMSCVGLNYVETHNWIPPARKKAKKDVFLEYFSKLFPHYKISEVELILKLSTDEEVLDFISNSGVDDKKLKYYKKLLKERK